MLCNKTLNTLIYNVKYFFNLNCKKNYNNSTNTKNNIIRLKWVIIGKRKLRIIKNVLNIRHTTRRKINNVEVRNSKNKLFWDGYKINFVLMKVVNILLIDSNVHPTSSLP